MGKDLAQIRINKNDTILFALKKMDLVKSKLLLVLKDDKYLGLLSIGDIQRAIINGIDLSNDVASIMRKNYIVASPDDSIEEIKLRMLNLRSEFMPIVDDAYNVTNVFFWEDLFYTRKPEFIEEFDLPIVVMAGGEGRRLRPLTNILPKPLLPINDKTMLEEIFERFSHYGCNNFFLSVNYKADLIKYYVENLDLPYSIEYIDESKPLGTAGSLSLLKGRIDSTFFVTNCDILIDQDYSEILRYHYENQNEITIVAVIKNYPISYGTIETGQNGYLTDFNERPELTLKINSGMYILEPDVLSDIPLDTFFHITDLIHKVKERNGLIGVFPVSAGSWRDIGNWEDYNIKSAKI